MKKLCDEVLNLLEAAKPKMKVGSIVFDYTNIDKHKVLAMSQDYRKVSKYDTTGGPGDEWEEQGRKIQKDIWYVGVEALDDKENYVFITSAGSDTLGI